MRLEDIIEAAGVLIVAAHPDDEVIGAGAQFPAIGARLTVVHVTDGAPPSSEDALRAGFSTRDDYAAARYDESLTAAAHGGIAHSQFRRLGFRDQSAVFELENVVRELTAAFDEFHPRIVLTHPYEGGHPDHDATAFAVRAAAKLGAEAPQIFEFTSYHASAGGAMVTGEFLPADADEIVCSLSVEQRGLKKRMFDSFRTQQHVLRCFGLEEERFRVAPEYDFSKAPHEGRLYYENFEWGVNGARFRELVSICHSRLLASPTR
jgi:N-acetylglucosamine malate deacetylase 2